MRRRAAAGTTRQCIAQTEVAVRAGSPVWAHAPRRHHHRLRPRRKRRRPSGRLRLTRSVQAHACSASRLHTAARPRALARQLAAAAGARPRLHCGEDRARPPSPRARTRAAHHQRKQKASAHPDPRRCCRGRARAATRDAADRAPTQPRPRAARREAAGRPRSLDGAAPPPRASADVEGVVARGRAGGTCLRARLERAAAASQRSRAATQQVVRGGASQERVATAACTLQRPMGQPPAGAPQVGAREAGRLAAPCLARAQTPMDAGRARSNVPVKAEVSAGAICPVRAIGERRVLGVAPPSPL
eukprot:scaffold116444_cov31-Tisochrysis_lutea.AAC.2